LNDYFKGREDVLANTKASIKMLEPEDIAQVICNIMQTPIHVEVGDVLLRSVDQGV
jgi:NADP-dependent 3-hydroxy acid dehydrogenase YdfG